MAKREWLNARDGWGILCLAAYIGGIAVVAWSVWRVSRMAEPDTAFMLGALFVALAAGGLGRFAHVRWRRAVVAYLGYDVFARDSRRSPEGT